MIAERKKLLITGDWHITEDIPKNRVDDYRAALMEKLEYIFSYARECNCCILQPGDFFDRPTPPYRLFSDVVALLKSYRDVMVCSVYGQHDLRYRQKDNTALKALESSCDNFLILSDDKTYQYGGYVIYGCSYGGEIPKIKDRDRKSVLLIHKMVVKNKLWQQQTDFVYAKNLLQEHDFKIIVSGDNHIGFTEVIDGKVLFNCGSLMRSTVAQMNHCPVAYCVDGDKCEMIRIPIEENVFDEDRVEKEKARSAELDAFVSGLSENKEMGLNFEDNLLAYFKENDVDKEIQEFIMRCLRD